jgi:hypothetical protein
MVSYATRMVIHILSPAKHRTKATGSSQFTNEEANLWMNNNLAFPFLRCPSTHHVFGVAAPNEFAASDRLRFLRGNENRARDQDRFDFYPNAQFPRIWIHGLKEMQCPNIRSVNIIFANELSVAEGHLSSSVYLAAMIYMNTRIC